jgi:hypothetical protein
MIASICTERYPTVLKSYDLWHLHRSTGSHLRFVTATHSILFNTVPIRKRAINGESAVYKSLVAADAEAGRTSASSVVFFFRTFYERLFEVAPSVRPLFKSDMSVQGRALVKVCVF